MGGHDVIEGLLGLHMCEESIIEFERNMHQHVMQ